MLFEKMYCHLFHGFLCCNYIIEQIKRKYSKNENIFEIIFFEIKQVQQENTEALARRCCAKRDSGTGVFL